MKALAVFFLAAALACAADVTGTWNAKVETPSGTGTPTITLKQNGENLTGEYDSAVLGKVKLTGTVKGDDVTFRFTADAQGQTVNVVYKAKLEGGTRMSGTAEFGDFGSGTFTAEKKQ